MACGLPIFGDETNTRDLLPMSGYENGATVRSAEQERSQQQRVQRLCQSW